MGEISGTTHAGTHADAPIHIDPAGASVDALPLDAFAGPAMLVDVAGGEASISRADIEAALEAAARGEAREPASVPIERLLLRTGCDWTAGFPARFRGLDAGAAAWCADQGLALVGTDAPSVDALASNTLDAHRVLIAAGVAIVEGLALAGIDPGRYALVAFPLRWVDADASPVRAALRRIEP